MRSSDSAAGTLSLRKAAAEFERLQKTHSYRNDLSPQVTQLARQLATLAAAATKNKRKKHRLLILQWRCQGLLEVRPKQWEILGQLEFLGLSNAQTISKMRAATLLAWKPRLGPEDFRKKATKVAAALDGDSPIKRRLAFQADAIHLLDVFADGERATGAAVRELRMACASSEAGSSNIASAARHLSRRDEEPLSLLFAFVGVVRNLGWLTQKAALDYPAIDAALRPSARLPDAAGLLRRALEPMSPEQRGLSVDYLLQRFYDEIFSVPYAGDDETTLVILEHRLAHLADRAGRPSAPELIRLFRAAASRMDFWTSPEARSDWVHRISLLAADSPADSGDICTLRGMLAWISGDTAATDANFCKAAALLAAGGSISTKAVCTYIPRNIDADPLDYERRFSCGKTLADLSSLRNLRESTGQDACVVTSADARYFAKYGQTYATSFRQLNPSLPLVFHVIDPTEESHALFSAMEERHGGLFLTTEQSVYRAPFYYTVVRLLRARDILTETRCTTFFTDIDSSFHSSCDDLLAYSRGFDLSLRIYDRPRLFRVRESEAFCKYPKLEPRQRVNAAAFAFSPTAKGQAAAMRLREWTASALAKVASENSTNWWIDQNILYRFEQELKSDKSLRFGNLEEALIPYSRFRKIALSDPDLYLRWRASTLLAKNPQDPR